MSRWAQTNNPLTPDQKRELRRVAQEIMAEGRGILAADESTGTFGKRLGSIGLENTEGHRRFYRAALFDEAARVKEAIGGVILFEETLYQRHEDGTLITKPLVDSGIKLGIKVDKGIADQEGCPGEVFTKGLDGLLDRCVQYKKDGCVFAKWRGVLKISDTTPSDANLARVTGDLAEYARVCQQAGLVPIVEPEVLQDGHHSIEVCQRVQERMLCAQFAALRGAGVYVEGTLLKVSMVIPGAGCEERASPQEVGWRTVTAFQRTVPVAMPGVVFLSGGLSEQDSSVFLNAVNQVAATKPWRLSFSYGRALQASAIKAWAGKPENRGALGDAFVERALANGEASQGKLAHQQTGDAESQFEPDRVY